MVEKDAHTPEDEYIQMRSSVYGVKFDPISALSTAGPEKRPSHDVTAGVLEVMFSITLDIRDYLTKKLAAEECLDAIKKYLIAMVESWNNSNHNLHAGIASIVSSFDTNKDYRYLSLRWPSILDPDSGVGTGPSTSSLPRRSRPSKESPLANSSSSFPQQHNTGQLHKLSLQDSYKTLSEQIHRNTVTCLMPLGEVDNTSPRTSNHQLTGGHKRRMIHRHPMIPHTHARRSYAQPVLGEPIQRCTSAPIMIGCGLSARPYPMEIQGSSTNYNEISKYQTSFTTHVPILPQHSHSVVRRPNYPTPLPLRRHSDSSLHTTTLPRFSPIPDDFNEDDEEDNYEDIKPLNYITPRQHTVAENKHETNQTYQRQYIEDRPNIGKLQKKLWKRNSTLKKGMHSAVHKQSLTHSSDASSDDSDTPKSKPKLQRRVSSYHPPHRASVVRPTRRNTVGALPLQVENANMRIADADQCSTPDQNNVNPHIAQIAAASEGDNEESEHNSGKHFRRKLPVVTAPPAPPTVTSTNSLSMAESDASSDTDQEIFYPYHSAAERVYVIADIGLTPQDRYIRLMGRCTTKESVVKAGDLLKFSDGKKHWSKYWFELRGSLLFCYKSKVHINRRPKLSVELNKWCKLTCSKEEEYSFEIETHNNKCRLKATSQSDMDNWMVVLQKVLLAAESPYVNIKWKSSIKRPKQTISGHLYLIEYELLCYQWANLDDKNLHFHTNHTTPPYTKVDLGRVSLIRMNKLPKITDDEVSGKVEELTAKEKDLLIIQIKHNNAADKYIVFEGTDNQLAWQYHLMQQCSEATGFTMTNTEKLIYQLLKAKEPYNSTLWNHPTLMMNPSIITTPLTTLPYASDTEAAVKLNETLLLYCSTNMVPTALEYHIASVQNMIQRCLQQPCMQNEFYCQVIRQTQSVSEPDGSSVFKAWQLLSFIIPVFLPRQRCLSYLEEHIARHITISKHLAIMEAAKYCRQLIVRTEQNGLRENIPSKFELSTLMSGLVNNSTIAVPLNTTVVFTNPQENDMKIEFDPCTMVHEVLIKVRDEKKCSPYSEFTLTASWCDEDQHSDDIPEKFLFPIQKLCDVISQWTDVMASCPTADLSKKLTQPVFTFKKRLFFKKKKTKLTNKEVTLLSHQFQQDVIKNKFPAERDTYIRLTGLMAQMVCGDYKLHTDNIDTTIKNLLLQYLPSKMATNYSQHTLDVMCVELKEHWKCLHQYKPLHCAMEHLKIGWKWLHFGSKLFHSQSLHNGTHLWLAVNEDGISELENDSLVTKRVYPYHDILSFGQQGNCFKLVFTQSNTLYYAESLLYIMSQLMIEEINGLIASYLERFLQLESDEETGLMNYDVTPTQYMETYHKKEDMSPEIPARNKRQEAMLTTLNVSEWKITDEEVDVMIAVMKNTSLENLDIKYNKIRSLMINMLSLKVLDISNNFITSETLAVAVLESPTLEELNLSQNLLTFSSVVKIAHCVRNHCSLKVLDLSDNVVSFPSACEFIVDIILSVNHKLINLNICGRNIRPRFVDDYLSPPNIHCNENSSSGFVLQDFYLLQHFPSNYYTHNKLIRANETCPVSKEDICSYYVDHKGGMFYHHHNFGIFFPPGAVMQGDFVEIQATSNHFGPYEIPDGFYPISSFFWISANYTFKLPVYVIMSHNANIRNIDDISHLSVLQTCDFIVDGEKYIMTQVTNGVYFDNEIGYCVLATDHFCSYTQAKDTKAIPEFLRASYFTYDVIGNAHIAEVCFCPSNCRDCEKVIINQCAKYNTKPKSSLIFDIADGEALYVSTDVSNINGWFIDQIGYLEISSQNFELWKIYSSDEHLKEKEEDGEYPPRFKFQCKQLGALETLPSFVVSKVLKTKESKSIGRFPLDKTPTGAIKSPAAAAIDVTLLMPSEYKILLCEPKMRDLNRFVVPEIDAYWKDVAFALDLEITTVDSISEKHKEDPKKCCQEFLKFWLITNFGVTPKNWSTLLDRISEVQELATVRKKVLDKLATA